MEPTFVAPTAVNEKKPCCHWPVSTTRSFRQKSSLTRRATPGLTDINEPKEDREGERENKWSAEIRHQIKRTEKVSLTWEVTSKLHLPVCGRMETVIVTWSQVDHDVEQVVIRTGQEEVPEWWGGVWTERERGVRGTQTRCWSSPWQHNHVLTEELNLCDGSYHSSGSSVDPGSSPDCRWPPSPAPPPNSSPGRSEGSGRQLERSDKKASKELTR